MWNVCRMSTVVNTIVDPRRGDTNVFISALQFGGAPGEFLDCAFNDEFLLLTSTVLLLELESKLRNKFRVPTPDD